MMSCVVGENHRNGRSKTPRITFRIRSILVVNRGRGLIGSALPDAVRGACETAVGSQTTARSAQAVAPATRAVGLRSRAGRFRTPAITLAEARRALRDQSGHACSARAVGGFSQREAQSGFYRQM